ncbi:MAG TPA: sigma-70 family RNA polymerase sigma factor [Candidatus Cloacimonadota bacterium]|jgi:RNA polymerase sigma-70 factor (ECF subfamily)|nr:sigma-70 family RNA polymerase sigma factor [Candidatus Cloacimonadota bacterium]
MNHPIDWEVFIKDKAKKLYHYILKYVSYHEDAEDIVQNTFLELYKNTHKLDEEYYEQWLYRVAHNKSINLLKQNTSKRKKQGEIELSVPVFTEDKYSDENEKKKAIIRQCFSSLKPKYALALELQFYQNKSYKEIADIMDITPSAVESLLVRAKKEMKKKLQDLK